jgi:hypothetical protein
MPKEILEKNPLNGLFQFASPATTKNTGDILKICKILTMETKRLAKHNKKMPGYGGVNCQL